MSEANGNERAWKRIKQGFSKYGAGDWNIKRACLSLKSNLLKLFLCFHNSIC